MLPCPNESNIDTSIDESESKSKLKTEYIFFCPYIPSATMLIDWLFFSPAFMKKCKSYFFCIWTFVSIYLHLTFNYISYRHKSSFLCFVLVLLLVNFDLKKKYCFRCNVFFLNMFFLITFLQIHERYRMIS